MTAGYIVMGALGPMRTSRMQGKLRGILAFTNSARMFRDRRAAEAAIRRTVKYAKREGLDWPTWAKYRVVRIESYD